MLETQIKNQANHCCPVCKSDQIKKITSFQLKTDINWMESRNFRSVPATNNLKKKAARTFVKTVKQLSGDRNLYLVARQ